MAFRSIGVILAELTNDRSKLQAAADTAPRKKGGEPTGEESEGSPTLIVDAPTPSGSGIGEDTDERSVTARPVCEPSPNERPVLIVVASRERRTVPPPQRMGTHPAVRLSLVVDNTHASTLPRTRFG